MHCMSTDMIWQTSSTGSADTERLGELLGCQLKGGEVIELRSDLGGGKTTFVRGLTRGTGSAGRVSSPTFTLSRIYKTPRFEIYHFDFYRLNEPGILADQLAESLQGNNVVIVEWADTVRRVLPADRITIEFKPTAASPDKRDIRISYPERNSQLISYLRTGYATDKP